MAYNYGNPVLKTIYYYPSEQDAEYVLQWGTIYIRDETVNMTTEIFAGHLNNLKECYIGMSGKVRCAIKQVLLI
jgi:hypothetical protein